MHPPTQALLLQVAGSASFGGPALEIALIVLSALVGALLSGLTQGLSIIPNERLLAVRDEGGADGKTAARLIDQRATIRARVLTGRVLSVASVSGFTAHLVSTVLGDDQLVLTAVFGAALAYAILAEVAQTLVRSRANRITMPLLRACYPIELFLAPFALPIFYVSRFAERYFPEDDVAAGAAALTADSGAGAGGGGASSSSAAAGATAADDLATAAARAAAFDGRRFTTAAAAARLTGRSGLAAARLTGSRSSLAVATVLLVAEEAAVAAVLLVVAEEAAVATSTAMAAVAGDGARVTADEGDGNQRDEHGKTETEKTLHRIPPDEITERGCVPEAVTKQPRSGTATGPQQQSESRNHPGKNHHPATSSPALQELRIGESLRPGQSRQLS